MAKYNSKNNNARKGLKYLNESKSSMASEEASVFVDEINKENQNLTPQNEQENQNSTLSEQEIIKEIEAAMTEGTSKIDTVIEDEDEDDNPTSYATTEVPTAQRSPTKNKVLEEKNSPSFSRLSRKAKREAKKAAYKKTTFKHKLKVMGVLMFLGVFIGSGLGVWYFDNFLKSNTDYSADPADFVQSVDETLLRNFSGINLANMQDWVDYAKGQGKTPADLSPTDNFVLAEYNASIASSYTSVGEGHIKTMGQNQYMYSERKFDGSKYSFVSISPSTLPALVADVAVCDIMTKGSSTIYSYQGPIIEGNKSAKWAYSSSYSKDEYSILTGVAINDLHPYLVCGKSGYETVASFSEVTQDENGNYVFTLELDKVNGVLKYVRQVKRTGGLAFLPEFSSIIQTVTISPEWELIRLEVAEKYSAIKMGVNAPIDATLNFNFTFNEPVTLPSVPPAV